ncbi:hypothetical protein [Pseudonocardia acaciae]|uniref:hypothetical protein n=1 Tax=Pseudonocardia acaciae TaxID=551276 RepID=UPI00048ABD4C|nr:hypothetical protein [Pseudonocardia acaciae]
MKTTSTSRRTIGVLATSITVLGLVLGAAGRAGDRGVVTAAPAPVASVASVASVPWATVTDPGSGASVRLAGPAQPGTMPVQGRLMLYKYVASLPNDGGQQRLNVTDLAAPVRDPEAMTKKIADQVGGTVIASKPVTVNNYPGGDFRVTTDMGGRRVLVLGRVAYTPRHSVQVLTLALVENERDAVPLHEQAVASLRIP